MKAITNIITIFCPYDHCIIFCKPIQHDFLASIANLCICVSWLNVLLIKFLESWTVKKAKLSLKFTDKPLVSKGTNKVDIRNRMIKHLENEIKKKNIQFLNLHFKGWEQNRSKCFFTLYTLRSFSLLTLNLQNNKIFIILKLAVNERHNYIEEVYKQYYRTPNTKLCLFFIFNSISHKGIKDIVILTELVLADFKILRLFFFVRKSSSCQNDMRYWFKMTSNKLLLPWI